MHFTLLDGMLNRWRGLRNVRRSPQSRRLQVEMMEGRQLLSGDPLMLINSPSVIEGTGGSTTVIFTVSLIGAASEPVTVDYQTVNNTAVAGSDYNEMDGTLTFAPGQTSQVISVPIVTDSRVEQTEAFGMQLSNASNARIIVSRGNGLIVDDDAPVDPKLSINDVRMTRGLHGSTSMVFTVSLNTTLTDPVTVRANTRDVTARAGSDYESKSQWLTFQPGERTQQFVVTIYGTPKVTSTKVFFVELSGTDLPFTRRIGAGLLIYGA